MSHSAWIDPRIDRVTVSDVRTYLQDRGWRQQRSRPELLVFEGPDDDDGDPLVLVLPSSEKARDYRLRLEDLFGALSVIEDRPAADVLSDVLAGVSTNGVPQPHPDNASAQNP
jgi:hypothetical protein